MAQNTPSFDPLLSWAAGVLGTITLAWVGATSKTTNVHAVKIAVLEKGQANIEKSLDRLEEHFGTKPKE